MVRWSAKWVMPLFIVMPVFLVWFVSQLGPSQRSLLDLGISTIASGMFTAVTRTVIVVIMSSIAVVGVVYFFAWRTPADFNSKHAKIIILLAFCATFSSEYVREMLRKPYIVVGHMYSNGVRKSEVERFNREGYLPKTQWVGISGDANLARGEAMFRGQCKACHTKDVYRSMKRLLADRDKDAIGNFLKILHENKDDSPYRKYMPPLVGTPDEINALRDYLSTLSKKENVKH
jgi:hypothetical protein